MSSSFVPKATQNAGGNALPNPRMKIPHSKPISIPQPQNVAMEFNKFSNFFGKTHHSKRKQQNVPQSGNDSVSPSPSYSQSMHLTTAERAFRIATESLFDSNQKSSQTDTNNDSMDSNINANSDHSSSSSQTYSISNDWKLNPQIVDGNEIESGEQYREVMKKYYMDSDTGSTISGSDIPDDTSSITSEGRSLSGTPRVGFPPLIPNTTLTTSKSTTPTATTPTRGGTLSKPPPPPPPNSKPPPLKSYRLSLPTTTALGSPNSTPHQSHNRTQSASSLLFSRFSRRQNVRPNAALARTPTNESTPKVSRRLSDVDEKQEKNSQTVPYHRRHWSGPGQGLSHSLGNNSSIIIPPPPRVQRKPSPKKKNGSRVRSPSEPISRGGQPGMNPDMNSNSVPPSTRNSRHSQRIPHSPLSEKRPTPRHTLRKTKSTEKIARHRVHSSDNIAHLTSKSNESTPAVLSRRHSTSSATNSGGSDDPMSTYDRKVYASRQAVLRRLAKGNSKREVVSKMEVSMQKVEERLKLYVRQLVALQAESIKQELNMNTELKEWERRANWEIASFCRSYYQNLQLLMSLQTDVTKLHCKCFSSKYRELKRVYERVRKQMKKFSLDDLILTVEAAMMTASNIRLPPDIAQMRSQENALAAVVKELSGKYEEKKLDVIKPMTKEDRTKHLLTLLIQIVDTSMSAKTHKKVNIPTHISDGLPYYHPIENGFQSPFETLLFDPRFEEGRIIKKWKELMVRRGDNATIPAVSTFIYKLTDTLLQSCAITTEQPYFRPVFRDSTNLMICRALFPRFRDLIEQIMKRETESKKDDNIYAKKLRWMCTLSQSQIGVDSKFEYNYHKIESLKRYNEQSPRSSNDVPALISMSSQSEIMAYSEPIARLRSIEDTIVPQDAIVLLIGCIHSIKNCALRYYSINEAADRLSAMVDTTPQPTTITDLPSPLPQPHSHDSPSNTESKESIFHTPPSPPSPVAVSATALRESPSQDDNPVQNHISSKPNSPSSSSSSLSRQPRRHNRVMNSAQLIPLSGDDLFPIVVFCVVQSGRMHWHRFTTMMERFYTKQILAFSQTGFCFSLLKAAIKYVMEQTPHNFDIDSDIE